MSDVPESEASEGEDDDRLRSLVRGALRDEGEPPDVLAGFQKKVRERSGGKFYADGWSTSRNPPEFTYLVTGILMLVALAVIYQLLTNVSGRPERVENEAAPVNVVAPAPK
ncbi:MAG TPA: hypothetical protein VF103_09560 [Polyangiaceae bacterium]